MNAHIIAIGDEILIGQTINSNAAFIGSRLTEIQVNVKKISVVGDEIGDILAEFSEVWSKNDLIVVTGGLGPTHDDVTREAIVKFFNCQLVRNEQVLNDIKERFKRFGRSTSKINEDQSLVPDIATVIRNQFGTAPGTFIERDGKIFVSLPGVPYEMENMVENFVVPKIKQKLGKSDSTTKMLTILTTGIPESTLFEKLSPIEDVFPGAKVAFLPSAQGVRVRITITAYNEEQANDKLLKHEQKIRGIVGRYVYGKGNEELGVVVGRLLKDRGLTISIAESCTGGLISNIITNYAGSSLYFDRALVAYSNASKVEILEVSEDLIHRVGAVSEEVAGEMAAAIRSISGTDIGLGVTGIMGPGGGTTEKPIGTVFIAIADSSNIIVKRFNYGDNRLLNKERTAQSALDMVRKLILGISLEN